MEVHGVTDADARGSEPIWKGDELVGRATNGGYGWRVGKSLALGDGEAGARRRSARSWRSRFSASGKRAT